MTGHALHARTLAAAAALALFLFPSCKSSDAGCTIENCKASIDQCHMDVDSNPYVYCVLAHAPVPEDQDERTSLAMGECAKACQRTGAGDTMACIGQNAGLCYSTDAGGRQGHFSKEGLEAVLDNCATKNPQPIDDACWKSCNQAFKTCIYGDAPMGGTANCPVTTMEECLTCADVCADKYIACQNACPRAQ